MLAAGWPSVPPTVRDAVGARRAVQAAAVIGARVDRALLTSVLAGSGSSADDCLATGIVVAERHDFRFRHELARMAVEAGVAPHRKRNLHARVLAALGERAVADPAVLAHHADGAGDAGAVLWHAPVAARRSSALGAHREAAAQFERALRFSGDSGKATLAFLHEGLAGEYSLLDRWDEAEQELRTALALRRELGDDVRAGADLRLLSTTLWRLCRGEESEQAAAGVRLVQVGNDLLMAGIGSSGNIDVLYQPVGSSTWSEVTATAPNTLNSVDVPVAVTALTEFAGLREVTLIGMAAEGPENSLNFWWQSLADIGSGPWHQEVLNGPNTTFSAPSIVQVGSDVAVAAEGSDFQVQFWWQQIGAAGWNSSPISAGQLIGAPAMAALASPSDTLGITWSDYDGDVYYAQQAPSQFGQSWQVHNIGNTDFFYGASTPSIAALNNNLTAITIVGDNNSLDSWMTSDPPSFVFTTDQAFPGTVYNGISTAQLGGGVVVATTQSSDYDLEFYWRLSDGPWHLEDLGGTDASNYTPPPVIALTNSAGTQLVATAAENDDGSVDFYWQNIGSSTWSTIYLPPGTFGA